MSQSKKEQEALREEQAWNKVDEVVAESGGFIARNIKGILAVIVIGAVVACGYLAYDNFYVGPKNKEAQTAIFRGQQLFEAGLDSMAIHGDGNAYIGFEEIMKQYGSTKTGKLAKLYAGISYARLGNTDKALSLLKDYKGNDANLTDLVQGTIGDCLVQQGKAEEAISHYLKAAKSVDNAVQSPILYKKAAEVYRSQGNHDKVIEIYTTVKNDFANSSVAAEADKYIEEAKALKK